MGYAKDFSFRSAFLLDVFATVFAFVAAISKNKTVSGDNCGGVKFSSTLTAVCGFGAMVCVFLGLMLGLSYFKCHPSTKRETRRNVALGLTVVPFVAALVFLFTGTEYKKKMGSGGGGGDGSLPSVCVVSHPPFLYITAILCAGHFIVLWAGLSWTEEETLNS